MSGDVSPARCSFGTLGQLARSGADDVCAFWPYGGRHHRPSMSDACASDCRSMFREVMVSTKRLSSETAKLPAIRSQQLCLRPPIRAIFRTAPVGSSGHAAFASNPSAQERGRAARQKRLSVARRLFCDFAGSALSSVEKRGPDVSSGPSLTHWAIWGRAATTLLDAGGSEAAVRRCRD